MRNRNIISRDLQTILQKNGLDAAIEIRTDGKAVLHVSGNRGFAQSPALSYELTPLQLETLTNARLEGTGARMKKAYNTFNSIVSKDFYPPQSYVVAYNVGIDRTGGRNRFTPVNMGWNGVNVHVGRSPYSPLRRVDHRVDGSIRPGESTTTRKLPNGMYVPTAGYVWKNNAAVQTQQVQQQEQEKPIVMDIKPMAAPRPEDGKAVLLKDHVGTAGNDTYPMLEDILKTHGIVIKEGKGQNGQDEKQLIVMAKNARVNIIYHLTDEEYQKLTADGWMQQGEKSLEKRLGIINSKIALDFKEPITKDMLNGNNYVYLTYKEGRKEVNEAKYVAYDKMAAQREMQQAQMKQLQDAIYQERTRIYNDPAATDGRDISSIMEGKAFFNDSKHGRQLVVGEIRADELTNIDPNSKNNGKPYYRILAEINGKMEEKEISQKEYREFMNMNNANRLRMFADKFKVAIKNGTDNSWEIVYGPNGPTTAGDLRIAQNLNTSVNIGILDNLHKGTYTEKGKDNVQVSDIRVWNLNDPRISKEDRQEIMQLLGKGKEEKGIQHVMTAMVDNRIVVAEMSPKDFMKFMESDDKQRLKIADKMFDQFKIKNQPGHGTNAGKTVLGILGGVAGATVAALSIKHEIDHPHHRHPHGRQSGFHPGYHPIHHPEPGIPGPLAAAERSVELFERITEDVAVTAEVVSNGLHK